MWLQKKITLHARPRGFHLITQDVMQQLSEISKIKIGIAHFFIKHTSASLTMNENTDSSIRSDLENYFNSIVQEKSSCYKHNNEGSDDMPAHIKNSLLGNSLSIPITNGHFNIGVWQGIYLCEHRNYGYERQIIVTLIQG